MGSGVSLLSKQTLHHVLILSRLTPFTTSPESKQSPHQMPATFPWTYCLPKLWAKQFFINGVSSILLWWQTSHQLRIVEGKQHSHAAPCLGKGGSSRMWVLENGNENQWNPRSSWREASALCADLLCCSYCCMGSIFTLFIPSASQNIHEALLHILKLQQIV